MSRWLVIMMAIVGFGHWGFASTTSQDFTALTLNIRYDNPSDGRNAWPNRREAVINFLKSADADFIGLQEATPPQLVQVAEAIPEYAFIARTRERDGVRGEATPLFWRVDRWAIDPKHQGTTWLSETPEEPGSKSWDSSLPRIVTWGRFVEKATGRAVWIYNTHFDHRGTQARLESGRLLARLIGDRAHSDEPVLVMGDFNCPPDSGPIKAMKTGSGERPVKLVDAWGAANPDEKANATWNGWQRTEEGRRIDLILVSEGAAVSEAIIQRPLVEERPISDHWPVKAVVELPPRSD
ncbi:MAG: endonuclease/exonuclease/phosphatase family protein [Phycisphaerales bacterium]|nr:endonuclease/exonuclease/phosphatase family protein [Phycisphaerales bacterium]